MTASKISSRLAYAMIVPGSGLVKEQAEAEGLDKIFKAAGFEWREPGCSMCLGMNPDQLTPGQRCASTSNRNFEGRQGYKGRTHLVSPVMAALRLSKANSSTCATGRTCEATPSPLPRRGPSPLGERVRVRGQPLAKHRALDRDTRSSRIPTHSNKSSRAIFNSPGSICWGTRGSLHPTSPGQPPEQASARTSTKSAPDPKRTLNSYAKGQQFFSLWLSASVVASSGLKTRPSCLIGPRSRTPCLWRAPGFRSPRPDVPSS